MSILTEYKGLLVVTDPEPTGEGGAALNANFRSIADTLSDAALTTAANTFTDGQTISTSSSVAVALSVTPTWNASGTTYTAAKVNVTNTASSASSLLLDLQVGGASRLKVDKTGLVTTKSATSADQAHWQMVDSSNRTGLESGVAADGGYFNCYYVGGTASVSCTCAYSTANLAVGRASTSNANCVMFSTTAGARYQRLGQGWDGTNTDLILRGAQDGVTQQIWCDTSPFAVSTLAPTSAMADANLRTSHVTMWLDETNNKLKFKVRYSNGTTIKSGEVSLS